MSDHEVGERLHVVNPNVGLVRRTTKRTIAAVDKRAVHASGLRAYAVKGVVRHEQHLVHAHAHYFGAFGVGGHMGFEGVGFRD